MGVKILNLTNTDVKVKSKDGKEKTYLVSVPPSERPYIDRDELFPSTLDGVSLTIEIDVIRNLPDEEDNVYLIVEPNILPFAKAKGRTDCICLDYKNANCINGVYSDIPGFRQ